jgi:ferredoxin
MAPGFKVGHRLNGVKDIEGLNRIGVKLLKIQLIGRTAGYVIRMDIEAFREKHPTAGTAAANTIFLTAGAILPIIVHRLYSLIFFAIGGRMDKRHQSTELSENSGRYTGRPRDLWKLTGWRHPVLFFHAVFYLGNTRAYVNLLATIYEWIQRHVPRRWYNWPLMRGFLRYFPDRYHGKVLKYEDARKILELNHDLQVDPDKAERVLTYAQVNQIVMKNPESIAVGDCGCRKRKPDHCEPMQVCMFVGEPFATYAVQHGAETLNVHYVTKEEALDVLRRAHEAGFVHNAFFKDAMGDRLFAICNCCTCCCGVMNIQKDFNDVYAHMVRPPSMLLPSGFAPVRDQSCCTLCGICVAACPFKALTLAEGEVRRDPKKCFGCGVCETKCPEKAIVLQRDPSRGLPLDIDELTA